MRLLIIIIAVVLFLLLWDLVENHIITTRMDTVKSDKLPESFDGMRISFLADLHDMNYGKKNIRAVKKVRDFDPDLVICGGDMINRNDGHTDNALNLVRNLCRDMPVIMVNGNHETKMHENPEKYGDGYERFYRELVKLKNIRMLNNESMYINRGDDRIRITGFEADGSFFSMFSKKVPDLGYIKQRCGDSDGSVFQILVAHSPNYSETYSRWGADLVLSGHNHGGMVRLPFIHGVLSTQAMLFPRYTRGLYRCGDTLLEVSAGMGSHTVPVRYFNPPEIVNITLKAE